MATVRVMNCEGRATELRKSRSRKGGSRPPGAMLKTNAPSAPNLPTRSEIAFHHVSVTSVKKLYRGFARRPQHEVPSWVEDGALFHIRIGQDRHVAQSCLTSADLAPLLLESARFFEQTQRWHITLFVLMPDHLHALLSFPAQEAMSAVISDWKRFQTTRRSVVWQDGYFDHRLRDDERGEQLSIKMDYMRNNPVAAGLCAHPEDWPWKIDPFA